MVRAGQHGEGENEALTAGVVGIGWPEVGDLAEAGSAQGIRKRLNETYPDAKPSTLANWAGQIDAFRFRMKIGDLVALPLKSAPAVAFGRISGGYEYMDGSVGALRHQRSVEWINEGVPRDLIDQDLLYSLGAFLTVCQISRNNAEQRIRALLAAPDGEDSAESHLPDSTAVLEPDEVADATVDLGEIGRDQIRRRLAERFKGHELARLIGELLRAEGFVCDISPPDPDGGVDILAGQGGMGFDGSTIAVQVKSGATVADAPALRELKGVMGRSARNEACSSAGAASPSRHGKRPAVSSSKSGSGIPMPSSTSCKKPTTACRPMFRLRYRSSESGHCCPTRGKRR